MAVEFRLAQRYDALAVFTHEQPARAVTQLKHIDGVLAVEPFRSTSGRMTRGAAVANDDDHRHRAGWRALSTGRHRRPRVRLRLREVVRSPLGWRAYSASRAGDTISVELLERGGERRRLVVRGLFDPMIGQGLYMTRAALNGRFCASRMPPSGAYLSIAPGEEVRVLARLKGIPGRCRRVVSRGATIQNIDEQMRQSMVFVLTLIISSACIIAIGVVYNSARIALSERGSELASLRVLGFTTNEVAGMLLGEQVAVMIVALPVGVAIGGVFSFLLARGFETERFHFPYVMAIDSQLFAMSVVGMAAALTGIFVRGRVRQLDMVSALRTRE